MFIFTWHLTIQNLRITAQSKDPSATSECRSTTASILGMGRIFCRGHGGLRNHPWPWFKPPRILTVFLWTSSVLMKLLELVANTTGIIQTYQVLFFCPPVLGERGLPLWHVPWSSKMITSSNNRTLILSSTRRLPIRQIPWNPMCVLQASIGPSILREIKNITSSTRNNS
jgi:hypothetical protein